MPDTLSGGIYGYRPAPTGLLTELALLHRPSVLRTQNQKQRHTGHAGHTEAGPAC